MIQIGYELHRLATVLLSFFIFLTCEYVCNKFYSFYNDHLFSTKYQAVPQKNIFLYYGD